MFIEIYFLGDKTIWDEMSPVSVDQKYLEYLFESRGRESVMKMESSKIQSGPIKEIVVLDNKRSNFINIGMTKFPPPMYNWSISHALKIFSRVCKYLASDSFLSWI